MDAWTPSILKFMLSIQTFLNRDKVNHNILNSGICQLLLYCFKCYLSDRTQRVKTYGIYSDITVLSFGVPQGAILSLLLFFIYCKQSKLISITLKKKLIFADDNIKLFMKIKSVND